MTKEYRKRKATNRVNINFRVSPSTKDDMELCLRKNGRTRSEWLETIIIRQINREIK